MGRIEERRYRGEDAKRGVGEGRDFLKRDVLPEKAGFESSRITARACNGDQNTQKGKTKGGDAPNP